jgi:hypothetical protein
MASHSQIIAGFEVDGEAEVRRRVTANAYDGEHLAHALQWLHELAAERAAAPRAKPDPETQRRDTLRQIDGLIRAAVAATAAAAFISLALYAYQALGHGG